MKALFIGAGSIGKRHIRDFYAECRSHGVEPEIHVLRRDMRSLGEEDKYISKQIIELIDYDYDVAFITNPTNLHFEALTKCKNRAKWYFVEKPIFDKTENELGALGISDSNTYVAAPMRHTSVYKSFKNIVRYNRVFSARVICSSYLPDWRKEIDYRENYSAMKEMGGGVNLDLIHEIDYVCDLFGPPKSVMGISGKFSDLEITSNDLSAFVFEYNDKLCEIHLDYFGRKNIRTCEIFTHEGSYVVDFYKERIQTPDGKISNYHCVQNEEFVNEMSYFYRFINGEEKSINPPSLALRTLDIAIKGDK